ncbi:MAG: multidrug efflux pump subunit AcrB [Cryomorphaceae bacterium]|jgi:multidrug efflux pump subunit AcrB
MEKMIKWFSENHVAANFVMLLVLLAGFTTWFKLKKEIFPETSLDAVIVQVPYPNATAEEVETGVILKLEDAISDLDGIKRYSSTSTESMGAMTVEVDTGYDVRAVMDDVKSAVDGITEFPENAEKAIVKEAIITAQVLSIAISADADTDEKTLRKMAETVRDGLLNYRPEEPKGMMGGISRFLGSEPKITKANLTNVRPYEISIEIPQDKLQQYKLTLSEVADAIRMASLDLPSGSIREKTGEVVIRTDGKIVDAQKFNEVVIITRANGSSVRLSEIAEVKDGFQDVDLKTRFDGRQAVIVNVYRTGEQDTTMVAGAVKDYIERIAPTQLPEGVKLELWNDMSKMLEGRMDLLGRNGAIGLLFVFIVLALFLRPSMALLVAIGIPVSFAGGLWMMPQVGISINMISLFAFILVLGIVVDDAIVVGENIYTRIRGGEDPRIAAWKGTHEVGVVVIFGVLTTMAAFTPMLGLSGVSGKIWPNIPLVVIPVLLFSLIQSKLVLPAHAALLKPHDANRKVDFISAFQHKIANGMEWFIEHIYKPVLGFSLHYRYAVWALFIAMLLLIVGLVGSERVPFVFMPKVEGDVVSAKLVMPVGVEFGVTDAAVSRMEAAAQRMNENFKDKEGEPVIRHLLASSGTQPFQTGFALGGTSVSSHLGEVTLELCPASERDYSSAQIINEWRQEIGIIPGVVELSFKEETSSGGNAIDIEISGDNLAELEKASKYLTDELANMEGVIDISTDRRPGKYEIVYDQDSITKLGRSRNYTLRGISSQLRAVFAGIEIQRIQRGRDEVKVLVRYPSEDRQSLETLENIKLKSPSSITGESDEIAISQIVTGKPSRGVSSIKRVNGRRAIKIAADVNREVANAKNVADTFTADHLEKLSIKFDNISWDYQGEQRDQNDSLKEMTSKFFFALLLIYVLMAIPLRSYIQPLIVMSVIPFGMVGAVLGHIFMGMDISIMSLCGLVALAGVVVNDSLVLVDYVNRQRALGRSAKEAVWTAGARRFRPIILTSLTTFAGLMPMLWETDMQARFLIPMAVSLGYGILFATAITLILVPSVYLILEDVKKIFSRRDT